MVDERAWASLLREIMFHFRIVASEHIGRFTSALRNWMIQMTSRPLPADWRRQTANFLVEWEQKGYHLSPKSIEIIEWWIESWAARMAELHYESSDNGASPLTPSLAKRATGMDRTRHPSSHVNNRIVQPTIPPQYRAEDVAQVNSRRVQAHFVSLPAVGHHWVPITALFRQDICPFLTDEALEYALGSYSTPTIPVHRNGTYGGVPHPVYSERVAKELAVFIVHAMGIKPSPSGETFRFFVC